MNAPAHELLETQEALRTKAAEIEQHGFFANQCNDQQLKGMLTRHQQQMITAYQQGVNLMQGKNVQLAHQYPNFQAVNATPGMQQNNTSAPTANTQSLSDQTMATLALNAHKAGAMMGMQWANECVDPQLRSYHVNGANLCQEMAYEMWSWMNQKGHYQPAQFNSQQTSSMATSFQPMPNQMASQPNQFQSGQMQ
ncbi:spore coat protein [Sediminibacillus dalangtanensis]|uniref:Spore coat protein n=1 Tax=Sediminibacillus dalangtanensis TaxID=2729421 RepID=A0ABX7VRS3_9BACI|nr:spore coat protein [Sediminibacillus dalangtanensis]QTM98500.1 spore coat protein [Sediminibacillus dalangtanensis]